MKQLTAIFVFALVWTTSCAQREEIVTSHGLVKDLDYLKEKILKTHPDPFYHTSEKDFSAKFQYLKKKWRRFLPRKSIC